MFEVIGSLYYCMQAIVVPTTEAERDFRAQLPHFQQVDGSKQVMNGAGTACRVATAVIPYI